jgi:hypothetical protein
LKALLKRGRAANAVAKGVHSVAGAGPLDTTENSGNYSQAHDF